MSKPLQRCNFALNGFDKTLIFNSQQSCLTALNDSVESEGGITLCSSRDKDGSNPYSMYFLDRNQSIQKGTEVYNNYASCQQSLR